MMKNLTETLLATVLALPLFLLAPGTASGAPDLSTFTLTGAVSDVHCLAGPEPPAQACYLEIDVEVELDESTVLGVWCHGQIAEVCARLPYGLRVVVIGEDTVTEKQVQYLGLLLEPGAR